jgi:hypothetical protein
MTDITTGMTDKEEQDFIELIKLLWRLNQEMGNFQIKSK